MNLKNLALSLFACASLTVTAQGTWTTLTNSPPGTNGGVSIQLTDGTIMMKSEAGGGDGIGNTWYKLTPNAQGSYVNGTWTTLAPMASTRLYFSSQVLKDGKVYAIGGEYGTGFGNIAGQVYNPITNSWSLTPTTGSTVSDANSEILPDGKVLQALVAGSLKTTKIWNPATNTYAAGPTCIGIHNESSWVKLRDNSLLMVDRLSTNSERYIPSLNTWTADATVSVPLYDNFGDETGGALLLPDGRAFFMGSTGRTAYYTPSGNTSPGSWAAGPTVPNGLGQPDAMLAMMTNGNIMCVVSPTPISGNVFQSPSYFYEFSPTTNTYSLLNIPAGPSFTNQPSYVFNMLTMPDGKVLVTSQSDTQVFVYTPGGSVVAAGIPTVNTITQNGCNNFTITGLMFNGLGEGQCYGDDWQNSTNYPLVKLTAGSNVYWARTSNWNSNSVQRFGLSDTCQFVTPVGLPQQTYSLQVIANGIASAPVPFTPYPYMNSSLTPPGICTGQNFSYTPTSPVGGVAFNWTRPAVTGITNPAILTPQPANPSETFTSTLGTPTNVIYNFTTAANGCSVTSNVTVVVSPVPTLTITGTNAICTGGTTTLTVNGATTYSWMVGPTTSSIAVSPTTSTSYFVSGSNPGGCSSTTVVAVQVNPKPTIAITGPTLICEGDQVNLTGSGATSYTWNNGWLNPVIQISPTVTTTYTLTGANSFSCTNTQVYTTNVHICTGVEANSTYAAEFKVFPNPTSGYFIVTLPGNTADFTMKVYDNLGRAVEFSKTDSKQHAAIDMTGNSKGVYFVEITNKENKTERLRIVLN
jgi:hypothetical protein